MGWIRRVSPQSSHGRYLQEISPRLRAVQPACVCRPVHRDNHQRSTNGTHVREWSLPSSIRFIALSASVLDAPVSSVVKASFLPAIPPLALISSTANSTPLRACVPSSARLPVRAVVRPNGIGDAQLAASAFDSRATPADRQMTAPPTIALLNEF